MSLLNFNFVMIYIIHKMLKIKYNKLLKNHVNDLKGSIFECFFKKKNMYNYLFS